MRVPDTAIDHLHKHGFVVVPEVLSTEEVEQARAGLWLHYPRPDDFFSDPAQFPELNGDPHGGQRRLFPFGQWDLSQIVFHDDIVDAVERFYGSSDIRVSNTELWAKYSGAANYEQPHHRDFGNQNLVVPRADGYGAQIGAFILLSDVTEADGPTKVVSLSESADVPMIYRNMGDLVSVTKWGEKLDNEVSVTGTAGTVFFFRNDVLHRASDLTGPGASRFTSQVSYEPRDVSWTGITAWPHYAMNSDWEETMARMTPRQRELFGFPRPGDAYWNTQTLADVAARYRGMDMTPYQQ